jgi:dipeptidyl aminopeptidase/acylaminoacyl peptidase|tara:strand:- start:45 stop:479 length:435 start_codon:yes stop_codon:yes gene_type:complete
MNIYLFDFDNTIVKLPYQETVEYLDQNESLDPKLNFKLIERTKQDYLKALDYDPDGLFLILSNRFVNVKDSLNKLLNKLGYNFEDYYLIDNGDRNKGNRVRKILNKYKNCKSIKFWEDKDKHIDSVIKTMKDYPNIKLEITKTI